MVEADSQVGASSIMELISFTGWGFDPFAGSQTDEFHFLHLPLVPFDQCRQAYPESIEMSQQAQICAGLESRDADACQAINLYPNC